MIKEELPKYTESNSYELWWCNVHRRIANSILYREGMEPHHCYDPDLGGITLPCKCSNITSLAIKFARE